MWYSWIILQSAAPMHMSQHPSFLIVDPKAMVLDIDAFLCQECLEALFSLSQKVIINEVLILLN
jgi:hypothetical protein